MSMIRGMSCRIVEGIFIGAHSNVATKFLLLADIWGHFSYASAEIRLSIYRVTFFMRSKFGP